ncbi:MULTISPECIES: type III secretion system translocon subunit SctE [Pseudomonas]|uniref:type III secretion system translocon subunit SctE n=1 Tax=Pseudomonas TaxID=286 RepID=UPI000F6CAA5A|nr:MULTISPECIES: type III secretion system translocon subunit SctE [Pseudomonas]AZF15588.1 Cell invasion protein SipB [Pseudomonas sp. R3-18-08]AZF31599.1 Cell invasion protein SipB [Pseudomonas sp. R4-35-07]AZF36874.1 Cell invasion protein SipB [Pseudomonas sp. R4-39-08]AZF52541.1 Cell invasion protein SipB [Pseudomonas sp. R4-34-07]MDQ0980373.1 invasin B [Pseudomonas synxantha]
MNNINAVRDTRVLGAYLNQEQRVDTEKASFASPDFVRRAQDSAQQLATVVLGQSTEQGRFDPSAPMLRMPVQNEKKEGMSSQEHFMLVLAAVMELVEGVTTATLKRNLEILRSFAAAHAESSTKRSEEFQGAVDAASEAITDAEQTEKNLNSALGAQKTAQGALDHAQAELDAMDPDDPLYAAAQAKRDNAAKQLSQASGQVKAATSAHNDALVKANAKQAEAEALKEQLKGKQSLTGPDSANAEKTLNNTGLLLKLMLSVAQIMSEAIEADNQAQFELNKSMSKARQAYLEKKSDEYLEEVRKAEEMQKAMGCLGKVLGGILTAISVVGAVFTGGASLAVAAVGLALMAGDMVSKALFDFSFMEAALNPIMEHVFNPIVQALGKGITELLKAVGVDSAAAEMIGMITGAILAAAAMVGAVVLGGAAAGKVGAKIAQSSIKKSIEQALGKLMDKLVPDLVKQFARGAGRGMGHAVSKVGTQAREFFGLKSDAASIQRYSKILDGMSTGVQTVGATSTASMNVVKGHSEMKAAEALSEVELSRADIEQLQQMLTKLIQMIHEAVQDVQRQFMKAIDNLENQFAVAHSVVNKINRSV